MLYITFERQRNNSSISFMQLLDLYAHLPFSPSRRWRCLLTLLGKTCLADLRRTCLAPSCPFALCHHGFHFPPRSCMLLVCKPSALQPASFPHSPKPIHSSCPIPNLFYWLQCLAYNNFYLWFMSNPKRSVLLEIEIEKGNCFQRGIFTPFVGTAKGSRIWTAWQKCSKMYSCTIESIVWLTGNYSWKLV